jgi:hypothetical protein
VLYSLGYPNSASIAGSWAFPVVLNLFLYFIWSNAIGGPEGGASQGSWIYNPVIQLIAGVAGMFMIVAVAGETINWLGERIIEMTGSEKELLTFNKELDSAVRDFVDAVYSSTKVQTAAEARIRELHSEHPELVDKYLAETLDRTRKMGPAKTAARVEMLIKELHDETKNEQSSTTA